MVRLQNGRDKKVWIEFREQCSVLQCRDSVDPIWRDTAVYKDLNHAVDYWKKAFLYVEVPILSYISLPILPITSLIMYKFESPDKKEWLELKPIPNTEEYEYRTSTDTNWKKFYLRGPIKDIESIYAGIGWTRTDTGNDVLTTNDTFWGSVELDQPKPRHQCHCSWDQVYQEGCKCDGL